MEINISNLLLEDDSKGLGLSKQWICPGMVRD